MSKNMEIKLSPSIKSKQGDQTVGFVEIFQGEIKAETKPEKSTYDFATNGINSLNVVALLDYYDYEKEGDIIQVYEGYAPIKRSQGLSAAIFKQEIEEETIVVDGQEQTSITSLTPLSLVADKVSDFHIKDYLISNGRNYQYFIYPSNENEPLQQVSQIVKTGWSGWSITELHPTDSSNKNFSASPSDVWIFNLNVDTGEQTQNITREQQDTLGQFPQFSQGPRNFVSGQVTCYLGRDFYPANYKDKQGFLSNEGGYREFLFGTKKISSNEKVDMLKAWRKVVFSNNPKLLKDRKGQIFLVTLTASSNTPQNNIRIQPDLISFSWTEIGSVEDITVVGTSE